MNNDKRTYLESLDPRTKFVALVLLGVHTLLLNKPWILLATALVVILGILASPITPRMIFKQIRRVLWFVLFITITNMFTRSGEVLLEVGTLYGTYEGLGEGLFLSAKIMLLLFLSYLFVETTTRSEMVDGVETTLSPFRKHFGSLVILLGLTVNFVPLIIQSAQRIKAAQIARGADVDSSFLQQVRFASAAALPLFVSAFRSSQQLAEAMDARCFDVAVERTPFSRLRMTRSDWTTILFVVLFLVALSQL